MVSFTALRVKIRQPVYFCQTNALQGRIIWYDAPRFPRRKQASTKHYPVVGFPSGQREQTVNLPSSTSKVRILPPPPFILLNILQCDFTPGGVPERPKGADCKSAVIDFEGSNPSPTTIPSCITQLTPLAILYILPHGKDEKLRPGSTRAPARERCRRQRPEGRGAIATSYPSPTTISPCHAQLNQPTIFYILPYGEG